MISALFSILLGFSTLLSQIVILREVFSQCGGNEIVYGLGLGLWLFSGGVGALFLGKRVEPSWKVIDLLELAVPVMALLSLLSIRGARIVSGVLPGESPPFSFVLLVSSLPLVFPSLAGGVLFRELSLFDRRKRVTGKSRVFYFEALGAALAGGMSLHPALLEAGPFFLLSLAFLCSSLAMVISRRKREGGQLSPAFHLTALVLAFFQLGYSSYLDSVTASWSFYGFRHAYYAQTLSGRIDVTAEGEQRTIYMNLEREIVSDDPVFSEEMIHLPASFSNRPQRFLLVGANLFPLLRECEKYRDVSVTIIDADYLHAGSVVLQMGDSKMSKAYISQDPVRFFRGGMGTFDVIVAAPGMPVTLSSLRTLGKRFFRNVASSLAENGIFFLRLPFGGDYIGDDYLHILNFVYTGMRSTFGSVRVIHGDEFSIIASPAEGALRTTGYEVANRLRSRSLRNIYFVPEIIPYRMDREKELWAASLLKKEEDGGMYGSLPVIYGLSSVFSRHRDLLDRAIVNVFHIGRLPALLMLLFFSILFLFFTAPFVGAGYPQTILFFSGAVGILIEIALIFSYQIAFGNVYSHIGFLFCSYMVGLAAGSSGLIRGVRGASCTFLWGSWFSVTIVLWVFSDRFGLPPPPLFFLALFFTGVGGGALFTTAGSRIASYSRAYALDLVGSSMASFTGASVVLPLCGVFLSSLLILACSLGILAVSFLLSPVE